MGDTQTCEEATPLLISAFFFLFFGCSPFAFSSTPTRTLTAARFLFPPPPSLLMHAEPDWFRGIAATAGLILVGNSKGQVLAFNAQTLRLEHCHDVARTPITTIATSDKVCDTQRKARERERESYG